MNLLQAKARRSCPGACAWKGLEKQDETPACSPLPVPTRGLGPRGEDAAGPRGGEAAEDGGCRAGTADARACVLLFWFSACNQYALARGNFFVSLEQSIWFLKCSFSGVISQALSKPLVMSALSEFEGYFLVHFVISVLFFGWL